MRRTLGRSRCRAAGVGGRSGLCPLAHGARTSYSERDEFVDSGPEADGPECEHSTVRAAGQKALTLDSRYRDRGFVPRSREENHPRGVRRAYRRTFTLGLNEHREPDGRAAPGRERTAREGRLSRAGPRRSRPSGPTPPLVLADADLASACVRRPTSFAAGLREPTEPRGRERASRVGPWPSRD